MDVLEITLSKGNIDNNHFYIPRDNGLIPKDAWGGNNETEAASPCTFHFLGQPDAVVTDIASDKRILRKRGVVGHFYRTHGLKANDSLRIEKLAEREFRVSPGFSTAPPILDTHDATGLVCFPERRDTTVSKIVLDNEVSQRIKALYDFHCQVCDIRLEGALGPYAEGAHIRGLGAPHDGPDTESNILCLCPNHHALFDLGGFSIADDLTLIGIEGNVKVKSEHYIEQSHLQYHRKEYSRLMGEREYI